MTAPPCHISGGVPLAVFPAHPDLATALTIPAMLPSRGAVWALETQALAACDDEVVVAAKAAVPAANRAAVPRVKTVRVARRPLRLNALDIRVLRIRRRAAGLSAAALNKAARLDIP